MSLLKKQRWLGHVGPPLTFLLGRSLWPTMYLEVFGSEHLASAYREHGQAILAFWHNRLLVLPFIYRYRMHLKNLVAMASRSRDGDFVASFLDRFGFHTIRGSSSKGGGRSFTQAIRMARQGYDIAIATDGPRGPIYQVQPGVIKLAQITSLPIVPASYQVSIGRELSSWDKFIVPGPFTKLAFEIAPIITVPRRAGKDQVEQIRIQLQSQLEQLHVRGSARLKERGEPASIMAQCVGDRRD
ncbi:MAG: DUF374 domain-containing protein [Actinobacteria bacterium]|nr:DUF374 domain-containing protein [Actinomycetota bacterium]